MRKIKVAQGSGARTKIFNGALEYCIACKEKTRFWYGEGAFPFCEPCCDKFNTVSEALNKANEGQISRVMGMLKDGLMGPGLEMKE